ncbi:MAG: hypothetical protein QOG65_114 [Actinomycetota bacterium]|nr:hypothetical protein [Actinomycetota bacterium]
MRPTSRQQIRGRHLGTVVAAIAVLAATLVLAGAPGASDAHAQETTTTVPGEKPVPVGLTLLSQSPWVPLRQTFTMRLHIDEPALAARPGAAIAVRIDQSKDSRSGFDAVIDKGDPGATLYVPNQISVASLQPDRQGNVSITFGLSNSGVQPTIGINHTGVYPVEVQLVNTGVASASFVTWLVVVDSRAERPIEKKLSVAFVLPAVADPIKLPDGTDDPKVVAEMRSGGRLDQISQLLARAKDLRISVVLGPETAEAWKRLGQRYPAAKASFARVRAAALRSNTEVLPTPYVPIDAASLEASGLGRYLTTQYDEGQSALRAALGRTPSRAAQSAFIDPAPTSDAVVNELRQRLVDRVGVREQALIPVEHPFTPAEAFVLDTTGGDSRGVATAPFVEKLFNGRDSSALRAERVIAALAEIAYETPSIARGIVIAPPQRWRPDLKTMNTVIDALRTLPLVQTVTLDEMFATISDEQALGASVQRRLVPAVAAPTPVSPLEYTNTENELLAYSDVVGAKDPVVVNGRSALLTALSTSISPERAHRELAKIDAAVRAFTSGVTADEKRITLTSRRADVPLSFENNLKPARDVAIRVHLDSPKLAFPKGADQIRTLKPGNNTIRFTVEARASGTFPMTISVTSPNGQLAFGAPVRVSVRSAVFGGWAVGVTIAAVVFLAGWWLNHFRRTRRNRRIASAPGPAPAPAT